MHIKPGYCGLESGIISCENKDVSQFKKEGNSSATSFLMALSDCIYFVILVAMVAVNNDLIFRLLF